MKIKKMAGALALTAALAMGSVPAFAASSADVGADVEFDDATTGSTEIKANIAPELNKQIKATVPMYVVVAFGSDGAQEIIAPGADAYKITNTGTDAISVLNVELKEMNDYFHTDGIYEDEGSWWARNAGTDKQITEEAGNYIMLTYTTDGNYAYLSGDHSLFDSKAYVNKNNKGDNDYLDGAKDYAKETIQPKAEGDEDGVNVLGITLGGQAYFPTAIDMEGKSDTLCKLVYTIGAADAEWTPSA